MNLNQIEIILPWNSSKLIKKWYKNKNAVTGSNQWKFDNKTPKIEWNISLISKPSNQWKVIIKSAIFEIKFRENQLNSCTTPYSKLRENQWKVIINSLKINENQWNIWPNIAQNWVKFREIDYNLTSFWPKIDPKVIQKFERCKTLEGSWNWAKWYKNKVAVNPLRGHFHD